MVQGGETDTTNAHFYMMIRPEDVVIDTVAPIYQGTIVTWEYLGYASYAEVKTDHGPTLKILTGKRDPFCAGGAGRALLPGTRFKIAPHKPEITIIE